MGRCLQNSFWTPVLIERARKLYIDEQMSAQQVAEAVGASSRSMITGLAARQGWQKGTGAPPLSEERVEQIRQLYIVQGLTAQRVSELVACSVSSVCAVASRRGWNKRALGLVHWASRRGKRKDPAAPSLPKQRTARAPTKERVEPPSATPLKLVELCSGHCRWPIGNPAADEFHFCGAPQHGSSSYCQAHALRATAPASPQSQFVRSARRYA